MPKVDDIQELLMDLENLDELLDAHDRKDMEKDMEAQQACSREFSCSVKEYAKKVRDAQPKSSSGRRSQSSASQPPAKKQRRHNGKVPAIVENMDLEEMNALLPSTCKFSIDKSDHYWRMSAFGTRYGRSWQLHGVHNAAEELLRLAWRRAIDEGYEKECPFAELNIRAPA